jgi:hypothetical protein
MSKVACTPFAYLRELSDQFRETPLEVLEGGAAATEPKYFSTAIRLLSPDSRFQTVAWLLWQSLRMRLGIG